MNWWGRVNYKDMKYYIRITLILFFLFQVEPDLLAQILYFTGVDNALYRTNVNQCTYEKVVDINRSFSDISFHPNGNLYGIVGNGMLYEVDTINGSIELIHDFENQPYNSLVVTDEGDIFTIGSSNELRSFNLLTNTETFYGIVDVDAQTGGDLTFLDGQIYVGELGGMMSLISIDDTSIVDLIIDINVGQPIIGLSSSKINCDSSIIYALLSRGGFDNSVIYSMDVESQNFSILCTLPIVSQGSATINEFLGSRNDSIYLSLDSISYDIPSCNIIIDSLVINSSYGYGLIKYILDDTIESFDGIFFDISVGDHILEIEDDIGCYISDTINLECEQISSIDVNEVLPIKYLVYPNPFSEEIIIESNDFINEEVYVFNSTGVLIEYEHYYYGGNIHIVLKDYVPGIYYLRMGSYLHKVIQK